MLGLKLIDVSKKAPQLQHVQQMSVVEFVPNDQHWQEKGKVWPNF